MNRETPNEYPVTGKLAGLEPVKETVIPPRETRHWVVTGRVQGVGFRPFVYRLAVRYGLLGWVRNRLGDVEIVAQGIPRDLTAFSNDLFAQAPVLAEPRLRRVDSQPAATFTGFAILPSGTEGAARIHVPADAFTCDDCLGELTNPKDRRYRYPFINCTQCGPRYSLINGLPYDRANTTMSAFSLCAACRSEYENPGDRRFHAEPVACPACGPKLEFHELGGVHHYETEDALEQCIEFLRRGRVVAVKGIGGYHLMCDARNDNAVQRLRERKPRPLKPLAVMFPAPVQDELNMVDREVSLRRVEEVLLRSPMRPIVLAKKAPDGSLSHFVAPELKEVGVLLPYSPLHHLLLEDFGGPLVATSANLTGEPVLTENQVVETRLRSVADAFLHHNRTIARPADDPVFRSIGGSMRPVRAGRGCTPMEFHAPLVFPAPVLAVGGHMKNTIALAWDDRIVVSPHIGELGTPRSLAVFKQHINDLQHLYNVKATMVICDAHPGYASTRWAHQCGLPSHNVVHHHAHASALVGEAESTETWLVFTWDGIGLGEDGTLWGGEALLGSPGRWQRVASMRPFHLPGGEKAGRQPWRSAAALCWETGREWHAQQDCSLLQQAWGRGLNAPMTTAMGRLFDAAAALTGLCSVASFEAQGPMYLEAACASQGTIIDLPLATNHEGLWVTDWEPLIPYLQDDRRSVGERAMGFHLSMAHTLVQQARRIREEHGVQHVGLCGGVFQNRILTELAIQALQEAGFAVFVPEKIPVNDAGISFGQIIEHGSQLGSRPSASDSK